MYPCGMRFVAGAAWLAAFLLVAQDDAFAGGRRHHHHSGGRTRVFVAPLLVAPAFYYPRAYSYAPPPVYVEPYPVAPPAAPAAQNYWYYCPAAGTYYPYIPDCAGGWQRVIPQNPPNNQPPPAG